MIENVIVMGMGAYVGSIINVFSKAIVDEKNVLKGYINNEYYVHKLKFYKNKYSLSEWVIILSSICMFLIVVSKGITVFEKVILLYFIYNLLLVGVIDYNTKYVYIKNIIIPSIIGGIILICANQYGMVDNIASNLYGIVVGGGIFLGVWIITIGKGIGLGDAYVGMFIGLFLGAKGVLYMYLFAFIVGAIIGLMSICINGYRYRLELPFVPCMAMGACIYIIFLLG